MNSNVLKWGVSTLVLLTVSVIFALWCTYGIDPSASRGTMSVIELILGLSSVATFIAACIAGCLTGVALLD